MRRTWALAFLLLSASCWAQFTTVSGTVTDPNGLPYSNGTITATLVISATPVFTATNLPYTPPADPVGLNSAGSFVMQLANDTQLTPGGGRYTFKVCSAAGTVQPAGGTGPVCFSVTNVNVTGASLSITATLNAAALALTKPVATSTLGTPLTFPNTTTIQPTSGNLLTWQLPNNDNLSLQAPSGVGNAVLTLNSGLASFFATAGTSPGQITIDGTGPGINITDGTIAITDAQAKVAAIVSVSTKFAASGCTNSATVGGASVGRMTIGQNTACTVVITMGSGATAPNGWSCFANDQTAVPAVAIRQTASTTTTASLLMTVATNDVINFGCMGY